MTVRSYLQEELIRRCRQNPRYSLRGFAKHLQMNPSLLSKILRGQIGISARRFEKICDRLSVTPDQKQRLLIGEKQNSSLKKQDHLFKELNKTAIEIEESIQNLQDRFHVIADWFHYAILELTSLDGFQSDELWIGRKLGLSPVIVAAAKDRMVRLGLLEIGADGRWTDVSNNATNNMTGQDTSAALRKLQNQILHLALSALENISIEKRTQGSMTIAMDSKLFPDAREKIVAFQRALAVSLQSDSEVKDSVYQLSISMFPVTDAPLGWGEQDLREPIEGEGEPSH